MFILRSVFPILYFFLFATASVLKPQDVLEPDDEPIEVTQDGYYWADFTTNPWKVIGGSSPMWHLAKGACYPTAAKDSNGNQYNGHDQDSCGWKYQPIDKYCTAPAPWKGRATPGPAFPTYYSMKYCPGDHSWRVAYSIYFDHDSGHKSDWEFIIVVFKEPDRSKYLWWRDSIIFEQDGTNVHLQWNQIPSTFTNLQDSNQDNNKDRNHPKVYVTKYHHAVWPDKYTLNEDSCAVVNAEMYRNDDWYFWPEFGWNVGWLINGSSIPTQWCWGQAASSPGCLMGGSNNCNPSNCQYQDMCSK